LDGRPVQRVDLLDERELRLLAQSPTGDDPPPADAAFLWRFALALHGSLERRVPLLREAVERETGFPPEDCAELVQGTLDYARGFAAQVLGSDTVPGPALGYDPGGQPRQIRMARAPWGTVAVVLPQNAFLLLAVTCLLNALAAGNRVVLRAPTQSARSAALLGVALDEALPPAHQAAVSVVLAPAREFVDALCRSPLPCLLHYLGGSRHAPDLLARGFRAGKGVLVDGDGNGWVWVAEDADPDAAADTLTRGALRYNGQTCTSINGAVIHPAIYPALRERLVARWRRFGGNDPIAPPAVGPLFDARQAEECLRRVGESGGSVLCGGERRENFLAPTLVAEPDGNSELVRDGVFGPVLWVTPGDRDAFVSLWRRANRYPLCAGVLSPSADAAWWVARLPNLARLTLNGDPSVEHLFEPWGGYPASGANPVGPWLDKYRRVVQIDAPATV
jgi:lactaldehyde dehydrogenase